MNILYITTTCQTVTDVTGLKSEEIYIQPGQEEEDGTKSIGFMEGEETVHWTNNTDF